MEINPYQSPEKKEEEPTVAAELATSDASADQGYLAAFEKSLRGMRSIWIVRGCSDVVSLMLLVPTEKETPWALYFVTLMPPFAVAWKVRQTLAIVHGKQRANLLYFVILLPMIGTVATFLIERQLKEELRRLQESQAILGRGEPKVPLAEGEGSGVF